MTVCGVQGEPQELPKAEAGSRGDQSHLERLPPPVNVGMAFTCVRAGPRPVYELSAATPGPLHVWSL